MSAKKDRRCAGCNALLLRPHVPGCAIAAEDEKKQSRLDLGTVQACPHSKDGKLCDACARLIGE